MTFQEAEVACKRLSEINLAILNAYDRQMKKTLKAKFKEVAQAVVAAGFKLKHCMIDRKPIFWPVANKNIDKLAIVNNRPDDVSINSDCTTRCISFCTGVDYKTIKNEQLTNASNHNCSWKNSRAWSLSLTSRGFAKISFARKITRKTLIKIFSGYPELDDIIATHSSCHVAALDMKAKKVLDIFDSVGGRVDYIYVPSSKRNLYMKALAMHTFILD